MTDRLAPMTAMPPSVGRIVHYVSHGTPVREDGTRAYAPRCRAAVIADVSDHPEADQTASLAVLNPTGMFFNEHVPHAEDVAAGASEHPVGTWHWPEFVPAARSVPGLVTTADPEAVARKFHEAYEELAPSHGYETREASRVPWEDVPANNKGLMVAVVARLLETGVIR